MAKNIKIDQLKPGMVIIKVTEQNGPVKIKKSGVVSSKDMVKALSEMGVLEVEIDPDITVDLKQPKITKSKTQQLLEDTKTLTHDVENSVSEQFNRNLFLPSVQELPEAWQYYGKKAVIICLVILGGLGAGFSASQVPLWMQALNTNDQLVDGSQQPQQSSPQQNIQTQQDAQAQQDVQAQQDTLDSTESGSSSESLNNSQTAAVEIPINQPATVVLTDEQSDQQSAEPPQVAQVDTQNVELVENNQTSPEPESNISPELLKRFQDAVESLESDSRNDTSANDVSNDSSYDQALIRDVKPVHELPAWALTRLPSMSFSTHMYASAPKDRWVRVNGRRVTEGQEIDAGLVVIGIEPQHVILNFEGQEFRMDALSDW